MSAQVFPVVGAHFTGLQKLAETLQRREKREDLKLLAQSYVNGLKNEAKKPGRSAPDLA